MYILKEFQEKAVKDLLLKTYEAFGEASSQIQVLLEAPTGSGKTVMMASLIERFIEEAHLQPGISDNTAFIWFAPNTLHIQSYLSLINLFADTNPLNCIDLDNLSGNPVLNHKDLLFVNWSSLDSLKKIWRRENESNTNLETLIENTYANDTRIILIIDEAHLSAFTGRQAKAVRALINAKVEISVTATPSVRPQRAVFISRHEVIKEQMIKKGVRLNIGINPEQQNGENVDIHLLRAALQKKKELEEYYDKELGTGVVNPLLLIQLPSENASLSSEDNNKREMLENLLANEFNISQNNGKLAVWLSGERDKDGLEAMNAMQDVLIFKQAIAQGWDCPRASVLISYRTVQSQNFGIQTVGRILRMPHHRHYLNDNLNYGYVYTNIQSNQIKFVPSDSDYFNMQMAERRDNAGWYFNRINSQVIVNDRAAAGYLNSTFELKFFNIIEKRYGIKQLPETDFFNSDKDFETVRELQAINKQKMIERGWEFEIDEHQIHLPHDIHVDSYEVNTILLNQNQMYDYAITTQQFSQMFDRFCFENITLLNKSKSWKKLRETLLHFAEYYLGVFEVEARKILLFPQNKALLIEDIIKALESFDAWQKEKGNKKRRPEEVEWQVPKSRYYNENFDKEEAENHALEPFYEYNRASSPEKAFRKYLVKNQEHIQWWYKNGDSGPEHFSICYFNLQKELSLFYVDFVIRFKSGNIGLFDTKTQRSDLNAPAKHNALIEYIEKENAIEGRSRKMVGGILIPEERSGVQHFRFCRNKINDTYDLTGWDFFNPVDL